MKINCHRFELILLLLLTSMFCRAGDIVINNNPQDKTIVFGNSKIMITLDYNQKCNVSGLTINGQKVISGPAGIFSEIRTPENTYSTLKLTSDPTIKIGKNSVSIENIKYGNNQEIAIENWNFTITENDIRFEIERELPKPIHVEEAAFPTFHFDNINTWNGAFLGYGGLAWFYLFNEKLCTYGVHTDQSVFWNSSTGNALQVDISAQGKKVAMKYSRSEDDHLVYNIAVSDKEMTPRYEKEKRSRFIRKKTDVWDSFTLSSGKYTETITLTYMDYNEKYNRGNLVGINGRD